MSSPTLIPTNGHNGVEPDPDEGKDADQPSSSISHEPRHSVSVTTERASISSFGAESTMSLLVGSLKDRLLLAVPKKGRLHDKCLELLLGGCCVSLAHLPELYVSRRPPDYKSDLHHAGADIKYNRAHRLDVALVQNHPIAL